MNLNNIPQPEAVELRGERRYSARSLSPAYWYVYDRLKAAREQGRGQVGRSYASEADALAAIAKLEGGAT